MLKFFRLPFASTGDKTAVPDAVDANGNVSYSQGYGPDYQRQKTDPAAKNIERDKMNQVFFDITTALAELQGQGVPDYITSALNGGTAYSYAAGAIVRYSGAVYLSLVGSNIALPSDATKWALLPTPALLQQAVNNSAVAGGTVEAITATFSPAIASLPAAPSTLSLFVRAAGANTSTTPTFKADGTAAKTIVKGANQALVAGDIQGAGHWLELQYDATLDKYVLQNPAFGVVPGLTQTQADARYVKQTDGVLQNSQSAAYTLVLSDAQKHILHPSADTTARTFTIPANASVAFPIGTALTFVNQASAGVVTIAITTDTMRLAGSGATGSRTLAANGIATALKITATEWIISGTGLT